MLKNFIYGHIGIRNSGHDVFSNDPFKRHFICSISKNILQYFETLLVTLHGDRHHYEFYFIPALPKKKLCKNYLNIFP